MCAKHYQRLRKHGTTDDFPNCSEPDCNRPWYSGGLCQWHHFQATFAERFWGNVHKTEGCWLWTGTIHPKTRYGTVGRDYRSHLVHRVAYEMLVGPIPEGFDVDHVKANGCTNRHCVKAVADEFGPAHLEPVTRRENLVRGSGVVAINAAKTRCDRGHELVPENIYVWHGHRHCLACQLARQRARRRRLAG